MEKYTFTLVFVILKMLPKYGFVSVFEIKAVTRISFMCDERIMKNCILYHLHKSVVMYRMLVKMNFLYIPLYTRPHSTFTKFE